MGDNKKNIIKISIPEDNQIELLFQHADKTKQEIRVNMHSSRLESIIYEACFNLDKDGSNTTCFKV